MDLPPDNEFNDHALKGAVRRCWASECAPPDLRKKLLQLADQTGEQKGSSFRSRRLPWAIYLTLPIAAAFALGFIFFFRSNQKPSLQSVSSVPASLLTDLVVRHDLCCQEADHQHLPVPRNDDVAIAAALHAQLHRAILVARPNAPGWTFRGAAICPVGTTPAGHLVFLKSGNALSIFSLPESLLPHAVDGTTFAATVNQHNITGFVKDGALFCLVGSGPGSTVDGDQLQHMRQEMEPGVSIAPPSQPRQIVLAELLHSNSP